MQTGDPGPVWPRTKQKSFCCTFKLEMTRMPLVADLQVLPSPPGTKQQKWKHVDAAIKVIAASGRKKIGSTVDGLLFSSDFDFVVILLDVFVGLLYIFDSLGDL